MSGSLTKNRSKKELGKFYTPDEAAQILSTWAIKEPFERILEPSFGACGFLEAATNRLKVLGSIDPSSYVYGCDIDEAAFTEYLEPKLGICKSSPRFLNKDFLTVELSDFGIDYFDVIVGNPPYVSYHNMSTHMRQVAEASIGRNGFVLGPKPSLWAHFLLHSIQFLRSGGRMAWILPSSFLFAEYGTRARNYIAQYFTDVLIVQLGQRLFLSEGTEEISAVLLADNKRIDASDSTHINFSFVESLAELDDAIRAWQCGETSLVNGRIASTLLSKEAIAGSRTAESAGRVVTLGEVARIRIGIVTGANYFFVIDQATAASHNLPDSCLRFILSKFSLAPGVSLTSEDVLKAQQEKRNCLLVDTDNQDLNQKGSALRCYLASMPRQKRVSIRTFKKRQVWHQPDDGLTPDAFLPYMYHNGPRLILNDIGATSTNTVHRVYFHKLAQTRHHTISGTAWKKVCAISILSTYSQLSGEQEGRSYGAGVLKHEPSEASRIRLILPKALDEREVETSFKQIDIALRNGRYDDARRQADNFVLKALSPDVRKKTIVELEHALKQARRRRIRTKAEE